MCCVQRLASASVQLFCAVLAVYVTYTIRLWLWPHAQHIQQRADGQLLPDRDMLLHQHPPYYPQSTPCVDQGKGTGQLLVGRFDCSTILFDQKNSTLDHKAQCLARAHMALHRNTSLFGFFPDATYVTAARDCVSFKTDFGYRTTLQPEDDADFPIAFNILVHHSAAQFERLLRAIYRPHNSYCVHIDAKAPESFKDAIKAIVRCFDNVFIASKLEVIVYAGFSRLQADINCMKDQLNSPIQWRYLLNMAANTYPLKTNAELTKILKIYNGANDIRGGSILTRSLKERWESEWLQVMDNGGERYYLKRSFRQLGRPPHNLTIVKGSAYGAFSRGFVKYMLTSEVARNFLYFCRATYSPDEHFWHTLHHTYNNRHIQPPPPGSYAGGYQRNNLCLHAL